MNFGYRTLAKNYARPPPISTIRESLAYCSSSLRRLPSSVLAKLNQSGGHFRKRTKRSHRVEYPSVSFGIRLPAESNVKCVLGLLGFVSSSPEALLELHHAQRLVRTGQPKEGTDPRIFLTRWSRRITLFWRRRSFHVVFDAANRTRSPRWKWENIPIMQSPMK